MTVSCYVVVLDDESWLASDWQLGTAYYRTTDVDEVALFSSHAHAAWALETIRRIFPWPDAIVRQRVEP